MSGKVIAILNQKGGCAKTTSTLNLSMELALLGKKILMIDADPQNDLTKWCVPEGVETSLSNALATETIGTMIPKVPVREIIRPYRKNLDFIASNGDLSGNEVELQIAFDKERVMRKVIEKASLKDDYDYIIIDCPPNLGTITINILTAADEFLIPIDAVFSAQNMNALFSLVNMIQQGTNRDLAINGMFFTKVEQTNVMKEVKDAVRGKYIQDIYIYETEIHKGTKAVESIVASQPLSEYAKASKVALDYAELAKEFLRREGE